MIDLSKLLETLKIKVNEVTGLERKSIEHKIKCLERELKSTENDLVITTLRLYTKDRIKLKIQQEKNLLDGYKKLISSDKFLYKVLQARIEFVNIKLMLYEKELSYNEYPLKEINSNQKTHGSGLLQIIQCNLDPIFDITSLHFYIDLKLKMVFNLASNKLQEQNPFEIAFEGSKDMEMFLMGKDSLILGMIMVPCEFFINKQDSVIEMNFRNFNFIKFKISYRQDIKLIRKNALITCVYKYGHGLENLLILSPHVCGVCGKFLSLFLYSHRCFRCKFTCHKKCTKIIFFQCKNSIVTPSQEKFTKNYNILHAFKKVNFYSFHYCNHCGEALSGKGLVCVECGNNFHESCENFIFNSCNIDIELRSKISEFKPKSWKFQELEQKHKIEDFELIKTLGKGKFGKVVLAKNKKDNELVALKTLNKRNYEDFHDFMYVDTERKVLELVTKVNHPFLTHMRYCFQDKTKLYFGLEYLPFGDLFYYTTSNKLSHFLIKLYACEIVLALEFLHKQLYIYRDLKLDNILMCNDGHIKLCDFGLCKGDMDDESRTSTICGTLDTISPEIIQNKEYTNVIDWWSFGVVLYEMYARYPPFNGATNREIAWSIKLDEPSYSSRIPLQAVTFIKKLLVKEPTKRLGFGKNGVEDIKNDEFFSDINWNDIYNKKVSIPYIPSLISNIDEDHVSLSFVEQDVNYDDCFKNFK